MPSCHVLPQRYTWCLRLCSTGTQITSPPFSSSSTLWQSVAESYGSALRMASGPFLAGIGSPSFHPTSIWRLIKQTNGPSILTRQISHQRSTAGFRQPWRISQAGVSGQEFNRPSIDRFHTAPPSRTLVGGCAGNEALTEWRAGMTSWSSRKEIVGKMCKWAKRARVALALRRAGARNRVRGPGKVTTSTNHLAGKPLLYSALLTMTLTRADASLCRKERGGHVV